MGNLCKDIVNKIKGLIFGFLLAIFLYVEFDQGIFWSLFVVLGGTVAYYKIPTKIPSKRTAAIILVIVKSVCAAAFLYNLSSLSIAEQIGFSATTDVRIEVLGEKRPAALGTEVWLVKIEGDHREISLLKGQFDKNWEYREPRIVSYNGSHAYFTGSFPIRSNIKLYFAKGEYSGKVKVEINGRQEILDLYSNTGGFSEVAYFYPVYKVSLLYAAVVFGLIYLSVGKLLLFVAYMWHGKGQSKL